MKTVMIFTHMSSILRERCQFQISKLEIGVELCEGCG